MPANVSASDADRLFLQALMSRRVVSEDVAKLLWTKCRHTVRDIDPEIAFAEDWTAFMGRVKGKLEALNLDIKSAQDEETGKSMLAFTNLLDDSVAQHATDYTAAEIAYFKQIMENIVTAPNESYSIRSMEALGLVSQLRSDQKITKARAQDLLDSFVARGWLSQSNRNRYSLGTRSLIELHSYIENNYDQEDLVTCNICEEYVLKGYQCRGNNGKCQVRIHKQCYEKWKRRAGGGGACLCMVCTTPWPITGSFKPIGEDAIREGHEPRRRKPANADEEDEDEDVPAKKQSKTRRSGRKGASQRRQQGTEEPESEEEAGANEDEESE